MSDIQLGRLEPVDLRRVWASESSDFTPWLAQEENLSILSDTLGLALQLEAQEKAVGPFRADILCKDLGSDAWVLIENQLERTDHGHLGQLLTYASGLEAVTIIWIAARFTEEHRSTLDWLNRITDESFRFFGLEVELWQIGDSQAAPKFNIISQPNDWSRSVAHAARRIDDSELSDVRLMQRAYWEGMHAVLERLGGPVSGKRKAQPQHWMLYSIGRSEFGLGTEMLRRSNQVRVNLYVDGPNATAYFGALKAQKSDIELELGMELHWDPLQQRQACRIAAYLDDADPEDEADWPRQHEWIAGQLNAFHRVFHQRVMALNLDSLPLATDEDEGDRSAHVPNRTGEN